MELKRQLASTRSDLQFSKLTRSISTSGNAVVGEGSGVGVGGGAGVVGGGPGSPYHRSTAGSLNGLTAFSSRPNLNKELMQKLRSMTETIKMLSDENLRLKGDNEGLRDELESVARAGVVRRTARNVAAANAAVPHPDVESKMGSGDYASMSQSDLVSLVSSYDKKLKTLKDEAVTLSKTKEEASAKLQEKSKYKDLARRLKEERNLYKDAVDDKLREQQSLRSEMEKMSSMIVELRENCQKLQTELMECKSDAKERRISSSSSTATIIIEKSARKSEVRMSPKQQQQSNSSGSAKSNMARRNTADALGSNNSLLAGESARKAKSVYGTGARSGTAPVVAKTSASRMSSTSSNASVREETRNRLHNKSTTGKTTASPTKRSSTVNGKTPAGPKIAKPVQKPKVSSSVASAKGAAKTSAIKSRLPQPSPSRIPQATSLKSLNRPNVAAKAPASSPHSRATSRAASRISATPTETPAQSPPPPPPPSQQPGHRPEELSTPTPPHSPPPLAPSPDRDDFRRLPDVESIFDREEEAAAIADMEREQVLRIEENGNICMELGSKTRRDSGSDKSESPVVPVVREHSNVVGKSTPPEGSSASSTVSCPEGGSADDEGSREGEEEDEREGREDLTVGVVQNFLNSDQIPATPRTRKRVESFKQGLAARRIQRTWKHFYEELEERRETDPHISLSNLTSNLDEQRKPKFERSSSVESDRSPLLLHKDREVVKPPSRPSSALGGTEGRKFSLPANINQHLMAASSDETEDAAVGAIRDTIEGHATRSKSLSILRTSGGRIHIARPWLKKKEKEDSAGVTEESSGEEELERICGAIHGLLRAHERREETLTRLESDKELFKEGKVSEMRAKFNERRNAKGVAASGGQQERSDGVTDDDDDIVC